MRQAIVTKYLGPTNYRGSRVKATCDAKSIIMPWDSSLGPEDNHLKVAKLLCESLGDNEKQHCTVIRPDGTIVSPTEYHTDRLYTGPIHKKGA